MAKGRKVRASRAAQDRKSGSGNAETDLVCRLLLEKKKEADTQEQIGAPAHSTVSTSPLLILMLVHLRPTHLVFVFFFHHIATIEIYTLSLHDALPISVLDERAKHIKPLLLIQRVSF